MKDVTRKEEIWVTLISLDASAWARGMQPLRSTLCELLKRFRGRSNIFSVSHGPDSTFYALIRISFCNAISVWFISHFLRGSGTRFRVPTRNQAEIQGTICHGDARKRFLNHI